MRIFEAFELPGAAPVPAAFGETRYDDVLLRWPRFEPADVAALAGALREARQRALGPGSGERVVAAIDGAARLLAGDDAGLREEALELLPATTRWSPAMCELVLDRMIADWRADRLRELLRRELPHPDALDRFVDVDGRSLRAVGPGLCLGVFSGNVPGVDVTAIVRCLLVRSAVLAKTAAGDPALPVLFARALRRVDPGVADCVAVTYWPGGSEAIERAATREADAVVVYGGAAAVESLRRHATPRTRLVSHGPRLSVAFVAAQALGDVAAADGAARRLAVAASTFDQHGCVSPHVAWVERGGAVAPADFAERVHRAMVRWGEEVPRGRPRPEEVAQIRQERAAVEMREIAGTGARLFADQRTDATVTYDEDGAFAPSCLNRFLRVVAVDRLEDALSGLADVAPLLQTAGVEAPADRVAELAPALVTAGFTRISDLAAMPWPEPWEMHDGRPPLGELIRWVERGPNTTQ